MRLEVNDLVSHMQKYKDAVIIIGPDIDITRKEKPTREQMEKLYTHKSMVRTPEKFWEFFKDYIFIDPEKDDLSPAMKAIKILNSMGLTRAIIDQNTTGRFRLHGGGGNTIELHGDSATFICKRCEIEYPYMYYTSLEASVPKCEVCGKSLRPNILLFGESYKEDVFSAVQSQIGTTHTLILVGMDYSEDIIVDLIANYASMKDMAISEDNRMLIVVGTPEDYDPNEMIGFCEFIVKSDSNAAMDRLLQAFK